MSSDPEPVGARPPFPSYLLPSFAFLQSRSLPFRRRKSSAATVSTTPTVLSRCTSPAWSPVTTPSSSPPNSSYIIPAQNTPPSSGLAGSSQSPTSASLSAIATSLIHVTSDSPASSLDPHTSSASGVSTQLTPAQWTPEQPPHSAASLLRTAPDTLKCGSCATDLCFTTQIVSKGFTGRYGRAYLVSPAPIDPSPTLTPLHRSTTAVSPSSHAQTISRRGKGGGSRRTADGIEMASGISGRDMINLRIGRDVNRQLVTGMHIVADVECVVCGSGLGWKYVDAKEVAQRYKIGKFILEMKRVVRGPVWQDIGDADHVNVLEDQGGEEDEDDYEDGVILPALVETDAIVFDSEDEMEQEELFGGIWDRETVRKRRSRGGKRVLKRPPNT